MDVLVKHNNQSSPSCAPPAKMVQLQEHALKQRGRRLDAPAIDRLDDYSRRYRTTAAAPPAHEWYTRRAALGAGATLVMTGSVVLLSTSMLQTTWGASALWAYALMRGPNAAEPGITAHLRDWAVAEGIAMAAQTSSIAVIAAGFICVAYAAH